MRRARCWRSSRSHLTAEGKKAPVNPGQTHQQGPSRDGANVPPCACRGGNSGLCEGVETALSVWQATGQEVWARLGVSNIGRAPVPEKATVIIARDGDAPGSKAEGMITRAATALALRGLTVMIATPPEDQDFNDVLREARRPFTNRIAGADLFRPDQADRAAKHRLYIGSDVEMAKRVREDPDGTPWPHRSCRGEFWRYIGTHWGGDPAHELRLPVHAYDGASFETPAGEPSNVKLTQTMRQLRPARMCCALRRTRLLRCPARWHQLRLGLPALRCDRHAASGTASPQSPLPPHPARPLVPWHLRHPARRLDAAPPADRQLQGRPDAQAKCDLCRGLRIGRAGRHAPGATACRRAAWARPLRMARARSSISRAVSCPPAPSAASPLPRWATSGMSPAGRKLLNASDELSPEAIASNIFKSVVTGEPIEGAMSPQEPGRVPLGGAEPVRREPVAQLQGRRGPGRAAPPAADPLHPHHPLEERIEDIGKRIASEEADLLLAWAVEGRRG